MKTENFNKLIQSITNRDLQIDTNESELQLNCEYTIYRITPLRKIKVSFTFKTPKNEEKLIKSFVNTFCNKYKEPNPENYNKTYGGDILRWNDKTDLEKEFAYYNHSSNMFSKTCLMDNIRKNMLNPGIEHTLCRYGFYHTLYGIGLFILFGGEYEINAINRMSKYLSEKNIPFKNQTSEAGWVYRFCINIDKDIHKGLLISFK